MTVSPTARRAGRPSSLTSPRSRPTRSRFARPPSCECAPLCCYHISGCYYHRLAAAAAAVLAAAVWVPAARRKIARHNMQLTGGGCGVTATAITFSTCTSTAGSGCCRSLPFTVLPPPFTAFHCPFTVFHCLFLSFHRLSLPFTGGAAAGEE